MLLISRLARLRRKLFHKDTLDQEFTEEIQAYLDMLTEEKIRQGLSPQEARRSALVELGGVAQVEERVREIRMGRFIETLWRDVRMGVRALVHTPGFTLVALLALALGIGTNTAIFSVVNGVLLRPLPFPGAGRLVYFESIKPDRSIRDGYISMPDFVDWQSQADAFENITLIYVARIILTSDDGEPEFLPFSVVPVNFFQTMGVNPIMGREFVKEDRAKGAQPVAIISYGLWQRRFGANPNVLGTPITLGGTRCIIIGVMPAGFDYYPSKIQVCAPLYVSPNGRRDNRMFRAIGRLKPWATLDEEVPSQIYVPHAQDPGWGQLGLAVRTKGEPEALTSQVRGVIHSLDKDQPPFNIRTMDQAFSESVAKTRLVMLLIGVFSVFALLLATVGIYGVIAYSVAQRHTRSVSGSRWARKGERCCV